MATSPSDVRYRTKGNAPGFKDAPARTPAETTMNTPTKDTRLVARVDEDTQKLIAHAAELTGRSLSQFLVFAAKKEALEAERQALQMQVSRESADRMLALLDNPEPINAALRDAALNHRKVAGDFKNRRNQ